MKSKPDYTYDYTDGDRHPEEDVEVIEREQVTKADVVKPAAPKIKRKKKLRKRI